MGTPYVEAGWEYNETSKRTSQTRRVPRMGSTVSCVVEDCRPGHCYGRRKMNPKFVVALAVGLLLGADDPKEAVVQEVRKAITALNEAFHARDAGKLKALMTADHVAVTASYEGPLARDAQLKSLPDLDLAEYKAGTMRVKLLDKDVALVTYPLTMKGKFKGKEVPHKSFASAVWVRREGKWLEAYYQETSLDGR
jgi:hypothetical protein